MNRLNWSRIYCQQSLNWREKESKLLFVKQREKALRESRKHRNNNWQLSTQRKRLKLESNSGRDRMRTKERKISSVLLFHTPTLFSTDKNTITTIYWRVSSVKSCFKIHLFQLTGAFMFNPIYTQSARDKCTLVCTWKAVAYSFKSPHSHCVTQFPNKWLTYDTETHTKSIFYQQ